MDYRKMSFISGVVIFISILIVFVSVIWLAEKSIFFSKQYPIFIKFPNVIGLRDHSPVYMRGYRVGWTKEAEFVGDGVIIRVDINNKNKIPKDSKFEINTLNMLGEKALTIKPGASNKYIEPGDTFTGENKDLIIQAKDIFDEILKKLEKGDYENTIKKFSNTVDTLYSTLQKTERKVDELDIRNLNSKINDVGEASKELKDFMKNAKKQIEDTGEKGKKTLDNIDNLANKIMTLTEKLDTIADRIKQGKGSAGILFKDKKYIENLNNTISDLQALLEDIKKNPKKYVHFSIF